MTARDLEILRLINKGHSYKEVAFQLGLAENTIKSNVFKIFRKLGKGVTRNNLHLALDALDAAEYAKAYREVMPHARWP